MKERKCKKHPRELLEKGKQKCAVCRGEKPNVPVPPPPAGAPSGSVTTSGAGSRVTVDLSARPELAMRIHQLAQENFRTIDMQVLYMLHQEYERSGGK